MKKISKNLEKIGFGQWFQDQVDPSDLEKFDIARVIAVHRDRYVVHNGKNDIAAELIGKLLFNTESPMDMPAVGDWVLVTLYDQDTFSIIHHVLPRKSLLKRKTPGKKVEIQMIAANIDEALILQSLDKDLNLRKLERYLVMVKDSNIMPIILLSKSDLLCKQDVENHITEIYNIMPSLHVQAFSNKNATDLKNINERLVPGKTYCLLGDSGVGKTSLLNNLIGDDIFSTNAVRQKDAKGRHTTTHRQLIRLANDALLIDTPGMREIGNFFVETGIDETFSEILALSEKCQFNDCKHINEKDCAVLKAVETGTLSEKRYLNFIKMKKEASYNEMSYLEKKQKDKQFGKLCKSIMKHKKNKR